MGRLFVRIVIAVLAMSLWDAAQAQPAIEVPPADPGEIHWDPAIRHGLLPNGMRYAVMHNATPKGGVSIRLGVEVGSLDEADNERGAAHFLEHMAFGGSHAQLQADVEKTFAAEGVTFGRDRNAGTTYFNTIFKVDLPQGDPAALDLGFKWLRQVADGAQLTPDTVGRERGVILAERETRLTDLSQAEDQTLAFDAAGTSLAKRSPIGTFESVSGLTAAQLQVFYDRWYRPGNAAVVVVGDEPLDALEARVRDTFGDWRGKGPGPARSQPAAVDEKRGLDVLSLSEPHLPDTVEICRVRTAMPETPHDVVRLRDETASALWVAIANTRLEAAVRASGAGAVMAKASYSRAPGQMVMSCMNGALQADAWSLGLAQLNGEALRLAQAAPSEEELQVAINSLRANLRGALFDKDTRASAEAANDILSSILDQSVAASPAEAVRAFDAAVEGMTPADVEAAFHRDWAGAGPLVTVMASKPPTPDAIRQAMTADLAGTPSPESKAQPAVVWAYRDFGHAGKVAKREVLSTGDFVRITFANGVRLNFKHTDFAKNQVVIRVRFGAGRREIAPGDDYSAHLGAALFTQGGLGRESASDLKQLFGDYGFQTQLKIGDEAFYLGSTSSEGGVPIDLQILAADVTDPGFRDLDRLLPTAVSVGMRSVRTYPSMMVGESLLEAVAPGSPMSLDTISAEPPPTAADLARVLKPALTTAPLEVTIVGDVDEASAVASMASTFGALPPRKDIPRARTGTWFLRFGDHPQTLIAGQHDGPPEKAAVGLVWPLYVAEPVRRREEYTLRLLSFVYQDALLRRLRGDLGKTYSPGAVALMPDHADQGYLMAVVEATAPDIEQMKTEMTAIGARIAAGGFTDDDLETVRKPYLLRLVTETNTNTAWASALAVSSSDMTGLNDLLGAHDMFASITAAEVRKAAAEWMTPPPIVVVITGKPAGASKP